MSNKISPETGSKEPILHHIATIKTEQNKTLTGSYSKIFDSAKALNTNIGSATKVTESLANITKIIKKMEPSSWNPLSLLATKINGFCSALMNWNKTGNWESSRVLALKELKAAQEKLTMISSAFADETEGGKRCNEDIKTFIQTYYEKTNDIITIKQNNNPKDAEKILENFFSKTNETERQNYAKSINSNNNSILQKIIPKSANEKIEEAEKSATHEQTKLLSHYFKDGSLIKELSIKEQEVGELLKEISDSEIADYIKEDIFNQIRDNSEFREANILTFGLSSNFIPKKAVGNTFYTFLKGLKEFSLLPKEIQNKITQLERSGLREVKERKNLMQHYLKEAGEKTELKTNLNNNQKIIGKLLRQIFAELDDDTGEQVAKTIFQSKIFPDAGKISEQINFLRNLKELKENKEIENLINNAEISFHKENFVKKLDTDYQKYDYNNKIPQLKNNLNKILTSNIPYEDKKYVLEQLNTIDFGITKKPSNEHILVAEKRLEIVANAINSWDPSKPFLQHAAAGFRETTKTERPNDPSTTNTQNRKQGYLVTAWIDMKKM